MSEEEQAKEDIELSNYPIQSDEPLDNSGDGSGHLNTPALSSNHSSDKLPKLIKTIDDSSITGVNYAAAGSKAKYGKQNRRYADIMMKKPIHLLPASPSQSKSMLDSQSAKKISGSPQITLHLKISGQRLVAESLSKIRPVKICRYEVPEVMSASLPVDPVAPLKTLNMHLFNRLQQQRQKTMETISKSDMKEVRKNLTSLERRRNRMIEAAKRPQGSTDPELQEKAKIYLTLVPTGYL